MKKDSHKEGKTGYPKLVLKNSLTGKGLFALEEISRGTKILQYLGKKVTTKEAEDRPNRYIFEIDENWSIDGRPLYNVARYFNHSCIPNAESILECEDRIFIAAKRKIKVGEEVTFDYGKEYVKDYIKKGGCKCQRCILAS